MPTIFAVKQYVVIIVVNAEFNTWLGLQNG